MLKNYYLANCSTLSFFFVFIFFLQEGGVVDKSLYVDNLNTMLILMTIICLYSLLWCVSSSSDSYSLIMVNMIMFACFFWLYITSNILVFYILFEISVVPMMFYVCSWGYSLERAKALMYMFMYTYFFSLPFIMIMLNFSKKLNLNIFGVFFHKQYLEDFSHVFCLFMFLVKIPVWGFHLWLPKAHVEASTEGSMILAGVVLKLAGMGLIKFCLFFCNMQYSILFFILASMCMVGAFSMGMYCARQSDMKVVVALSSIVHMSFLLLCYLFSSSFSIFTSLMIMFAHGMISPLMFLFLGMVYSTNASRAIFNLKGVLKNMLYISVLWFILCMFNMGLPLSVNFFGEMMFFFSANSFSMLIILVTSLLIFINGFFNSFLLTFLSGGKEKEFAPMQINVAFICMMYMYLYLTVSIVLNIMEI